MKKLILILTVLFVATVAVAQQTKIIPAKIDTTGPDKIPPGAKIEDLIKKLPLLVNDTNAKSIRFDCRDVVTSVKDTTHAQTTDTAALEELLKKMQQIVVDKNGNIITNGKPVNINNKVANLSADTIYCEILEKIIEDRSYGRITYKTDTVQYKISSYKAARKAKLAQLFKELDGFEVGIDGMVTHQSIPITLFKINNDSIPVASLSKAINTIPADAVTMVEVIDDYGDKPASIGAGKSAEPDKLLHVTLKKGKKLDLKKLRTGR